VALGDRRVGVPRGDGLALLGDAEPAANRGSRLRADRVALRTAAAAECTAAAVEHGEHRAAIARGVDERKLRRAKGDARGDVADLLAGVRVADHHLELVA